MGDRPRSASVRVPATSANLGPGFDTLGLALGLYDDVSATITDGGLSVEVTGEGANLAGDETHLVVRAMRAGFDSFGGQPAGLALRCVNRIPHSRGLGSSAAAIIAGLLLARALSPGRPAHDDLVLGLAAELEGHPDNVAPCLYGGLTIAWSDPTPGAGPQGTQGTHGTHGTHTAWAIRLDPAPDVLPVALVPPFPASTVAARGLLPAQVPHADAAFTAGRSALLVAALTAAPDRLHAATEDRLHQDYRAPAMPDAHRLIGQLRAVGHAAVLSGAGPTVLVLARDDVEVETVTARAPLGWTPVPLAVELAGARAAVRASDADGGGNTPGASGVAGGTGSV